MITCHHCQHENLTGSLACGKCQTVLSRMAGEAISTHILTNRRDFAPTRNSTPASFFANMKLFLQVEGEADPIFLPFVDSGIVLGRAVTATDTLVFDLTPYGAMEKGVSRKHAVLKKQTGGIVLIDNQSSNGTHVNGKRVHPQQPCPLRDGDELYLGKLRIQVCFIQSD